MITNCAGLLDYIKEWPRRTFVALFFTSMLIYFLNCKNENLENQEVLSRHKRSLLPTAAEAKIIVDRHNELRATVGDEGEEPIPSNMRYLTWDEELSISSLRHAQNCEWRHSKGEESMLDRFQEPCGENLWAGSGDLNTNFDPIHATMAWYDEYIWYTFANRSCVPGQMCGHYTQFVWATLYKIGCAWTQCPYMEENGVVMTDALFMVCQYAPGGNVENTDPYKVGERCSECNSFDTCPDGRLCRNEERDKPYYVPRNTGTVAGILVGMVLLLASVAGVAYYWHVKQGLQSPFLLAWRKRRRVSSVNIINENGNGKTDSKNNSEKNSPNTKPRETRLASINITT